MKPTSAKSTLAGVARLSDWIESTDWPDLPCPACGTGLLSPDPVAEVEAARSADARDHEAWEPEWVYGLFTGVLRCQRMQCRELVAVSGDWRIRETSNGYERSWSTDYRVRTTHPPIPVLRNVHLYPEPVREVVNRASRVIWTVPSSAGNSLRVAVELALTAKKIPKTSGPSRSRLTAHARIDLLRTKHPDAAALLEAVKWVGNQASHESTLTVADVLDATQILDAALMMLFGPKSDDVRRLADRINRAKRVPRSRK